MDKNVQLTTLEKLKKSNQPTTIKYITQKLINEKHKIKITTLDTLTVLNLKNTKIPLHEFVKNETNKKLITKTNNIYDKLP